MDMEVCGVCCCVAVAGVWMGAGWRQMEARPPGGGGGMTWHDFWQLLAGDVEYLAGSIDSILFTVHVAVIGRWHLSTELIIINSRG